MSRVAAIVILLIAISASAVLWHNTAVSVSDFTSFWIAGHQLLEHQNPYDANHALQVERAMAFTGTKPLVMRNPPWTLWITLPLGVLSHSVAWLLWTTCLVLMLAVAAQLLWAVYAGKKRRGAPALLLTFVFAPTLACVSVGQTAPFVLLGLALFLYLHSRHEFWAGFALLGAAFKPQLAFLFWLALAFWSLQYKKWRLIAGAITGLAVATAIALWLDRSVVHEYWTMLLAESLQTQFIPTLGGLLRHALGPAWLQIVPAAIGIVGIAWYYSRHRLSWDWKEQLPIVLLASMLLTPYAWLVDEVVLLLALIAAAAVIWETRLARQFATLFVIVNAAIVVALTLGVRVVSPYYFWTTWVWIAFYVVAIAQDARRKQHVEAANS